MVSPSDDFVRFILNKDIYPGVKTQSVIDKFRSTVKKSFSQLINDILNDKFKVALGKNSEVSSSPEVVKDIPVPEPTTEEKSKIVTTLEELECFAMIKFMVKDIISPNRIFYRDTESYFGILVDNNKLKWICRIQIRKSQISLYFPDENKKPIRYYLDNIDDLVNYQEQMIDVVQKYV